MLPHCHMSRDLPTFDRRQPFTISYCTRTTYSSISVHAHVLAHVPLQIMSTRACYNCNNAWPFAKLEEVQYGW